MKRLTLFGWVIALSAVLLPACQRKTGDKTQAQKERPAAPTKTCYAYTSAGDTIRLSLNQTDTAVTGNLLYQLKEKDRNRGTLTGQFRGDTLRADYRFQSEGVESVREVVFLRRGNTLIEGFGPVTERNQKTVFQSPDSLQFTDGLPLTKTPCPN